MATTVTLTRTCRHENESGLSGSEPIDVNAVQHLDQIVSAGTEEQMALGVFCATQLQALSMLSDQDVSVQFLGPRHAVLATVAGPPGTITHTGDLRPDIWPGDLVRLEDTVGDDGVYMVDTVGFGAGVTTITLELGQALPAGGGGAVGTVARVASVQCFPYSYSMNASRVNGEIDVLGNVTDKFAAGEYLCIQGTAGNDGYWEIDNVAFAAGTTTITVNGGVLPGAEAVVGYIMKVRAAFNLLANEAFLWSYECGLPNPFAQVGFPAIHYFGYEAGRGDVAFCMVTCAGAVNAQFDARIATNPDIF